MTSAEVMTAQLVALWVFGGNLRRAFAYFAEGNFMSCLLSESRFNRRLHRFAPDDTFLIDSCPVPMCRFTCWRGKTSLTWDIVMPERKTITVLKPTPSPRATGGPVEVLLLCARSHDLTGMKELALDLPKGAMLYGDKAYNDYKYEDRLAQEREITLRPIRKKNSKRQCEPEVAKTVSRTRNRIETTFSGISALLPRKIHAVTQRGFEIKVMATFVAYAILGVAIWVITIVPYSVTYSVPYSTFIGVILFYE